MLITEYTSNGTTIVRIRKDWHPARIGMAYIPQVKNYLDDVNVDRRSRRDMFDLQSALLSN